MTYPKTLVLDGIEVRLERELNSAATLNPQETEFEYIYTAFWKGSDAAFMESEVFVTEPAEADLQAAIRRSLKTGTDA